MNKISDYLFRWRVRAWNWLLTHWRWLGNMRLYVIADSTDNSVTFSKDLFRMLDVMDQDEAKVFVFHLCNACSEVPGRWAGRIYAFTVNYPFAQETQQGEIQYNAKYRSIGFESLCPTVNQIFYDYSLPAMTKAKLSVVPAVELHNGFKYYIIMPPMP